MACLCVPEGEFEELLEHVPLTTRRKLLLSSTVGIKNQDESSNSPGLLSLPPCSDGDQVYQHLPQEYSPNCKVTAGSFEVADNEHPLDSGSVEVADNEHPLDPVPSIVSDIIKIDCADNLLLKDDTNISVNAGVISSCRDVGLPINGNSQGSQANQLTGTEANADASGLVKINVGVPLPPNPIPSNVSDILKVDCADNMLLGLSKDDTYSSVSTGVIASCQDVGKHVNGNSQESQADPLTGTEANADVSGLEKINVGVSRPPSRLNVSAIKKGDRADNMLLNLSKDDTNHSANTGVIAMNAMDKKLSDFTLDELDHIVLKERRKLLLKRKLVELPKPALEDTSMGLAENLMDYSAGRIKQDLQFVGGESWLAGNEFKDIPNRTASDPQRTSDTGTEAAKSRNRVEESNIICLSERTSMEFKSRDGDDSVPASTNDIYSSTLNTSVKVKVEPFDYNNLQNPERSTLGNMVSVKSEEDMSDGIDHMLLRDRMKLLKSVEDFELNSSKNFECLRKTEPAAFGFSPNVSETAIPVRVNHPRKRRKTATDSVETALEEDAPGLLKVLLDQGVSVDEIKLYGESENDDALDESFSEDSFSELEALMTKLFSQRSSLLKSAPLRCTKGSKASYCLACLFSLVEQTRYLQFRRWPVEWGWCRDLQSFIFVFKRHHRIVLERPEYGYATYFFELLDSLPIDWQVKRLVTAMKLTSCGRITLIENKPLLVGEDLTEGEAKVLMEYGWIPNTGLGTMLNYCDRVVHDRKNESDSSEWRSKIGKLLIDAYNGGTIVSTSLAENVSECKDGENTEIKLEL